MAATASAQTYPAQDVLTWQNDNFRTGQQLAETNGWIMGYTYSTADGFSQVATFNTTPYGTGGGIWQSGAGLASETYSSGHIEILHR